MEIENYVSEFRTLQQKGRVRVAVFCRERSLDYFTLVEALKQDQWQKENLHEIQKRISDYEVISVIDGNKEKSS